MMTVNFKQSINYDARYRHELPRWTLL